MHILAKFSVMVPDKDKIIEKIVFKLQSARDPAMKDAACAYACPLMIAKNQVGYLEYA